MRLHSVPLFGTERFTLPRTTVLQNAIRQCLKEDINTVHDFFKRQNDNIIIGNQSDDRRTLKMTSPMLLRLPTLIKITI
ncbi:hypothetical protein BpHYR1_012234 [Brachionus plicatilis]|uniref:Uncharacterized protein n=1 Tax=Brachionus plicatilis TaxID=10195 RepID=A0A3M7PL69_BRAPC|nr:hypothetical protein BpHYR1_012234 [Brachionus plicatilis]